MQNHAALEMRTWVEFHLISKVSRLEAFCILLPTAEMRTWINFHLISEVTKLGAFCILLKIAESERLSTIVT